MELHCPACQRDWPIPEGVDRGSPFKCQCGFKSTVGAMVPGGWRSTKGGGFASNLPLIAAAVFALLVIGWMLSGGEEDYPDSEVPEATEVDSAAMKMKVLNARAEELLAKGDYEGAVALYKAAPPQVQLAFREEIEARTERAVVRGGDVLVERLRRSKTRTEVKRRAQELKTYIRKYDKELTGQKDRAETVAVTGGSTSGSASGSSPVSVRDTWEAEVVKAETKVGITPAKDPSKTATVKKPKEPELKARPEPAKRIAFFERRAAHEADVVAALGRRIGKEKRRVKAERTAMLERARETSKRSALNVQLTEGFKMENAVIEGMDDYTFTITSNGNMVRYPWTKLDPTSRLLLRRMGARKDAAKDQLQLGHWCLKQRLWIAARKAFGKAAALDRDLRDDLPDVDRIERAATVFNGEFDRDGGRVKVFYDFKDRRQGLDFEALGIGGGGGVIRRGRMEIRGQGLFLIALKSIGFDQQADVSVALSEASSGVGVCFGFGFNSSSLLKQVVYLVNCDPGQGTVSLFRLQGGRLTLLERAGGVNMGKHPTIKLIAKGKFLKVLVRGVNRLQYKINPSWVEPRLYVGGNAPKGAGMVSFQSLLLRGRVHEEWLRKSFKELNALLFPILRRSEDLPVFQARGARPKVPLLSAEDGYGLIDLHPKSRKDYDEARKKIVWEDVPSIQEAFIKYSLVLSRSKRLAAAYYGRGLALLKLNRPKDALVDLEKALKLCPRFYEAMSAAARANLELGKLSLASQLAEQAVRWRPTYPEAHTARGRVRLLKGDLDGALKDYELARALDPWDEVLSDEARSMGNVIRGPPWTRRFKVESDHYVIETNISRTRASEFAEKLEAIRKSYVRAFPIKARDRFGKSRVMIFDTEEGYHAYADLSFSSRVEFTLGVYHPSYRQLLLFEPKDDMEGGRTLETLYHEGFHQFLHGLIPNPRLIPIWVNEGLAEYFAGSVVKNGEVVRQGAVVAGLEQRLLGLVMFAKANGGPLQLQPLMQESQAQFYSGSPSLRSAKYGHAWTLVHYFLNGGNKKHLGRFRKYLSGLLSGKAPPEAFAAAFEGTNWPGLQASWWGHVVKLARPFLR